MRRVVITGMGVVSSIGDNVAETTRSLMDGASGITHSEEYASLGFRCQVFGKPKIDVEEALDRKTRRFMGPGSAYNYIAMKEALADAKLSEDEISDERIGVIMGSGGPSVSAIVQAADKTRETGGTKKIGPTQVPKAMCSTASATLAVPFKILGLNYSISSACATSVHCVGAAYEQIAWGKQDMIFAGGSEELDWALSNLFDAMGAMSTKYNDRASTASRAYDKNRDGFVIAGGAGVVVLEELERAKARGATIYGEITGYGANSDGYDMVAPSGEGAVRCMRMAIETARRPVQYINTHGTSTPVGDEIELRAVERLWSGASDNLVMSSTKSSIGHLLGAAGAVESIFTLLAMRDQVAPPTINLDNPSVETGIELCANKPVETKIDAALSNSFGFGGTNASVVFKRV